MICNAEADVQLGRVDQEPPESHAEYMSLWVKDELEVALSFLEDAMRSVLGNNEEGCLSAETIADKAWELTGLELPIAPQVSRETLVEIAGYHIELSRSCKSVTQRDYLENKGENDE